MRIVIDARTASARFPGVGRYISCLSRALNRDPRGHELLLLMQPGQCPGDHVLPALPAIECESGPLSLSQQWSVPLAIATAHADVYFSPFVMVPYWPRVPSVVVCHDLIPLTCPQFFTLPNRLALRLAFGLAFHTAAAIIVSSAATRDDVLTHYAVDPRKITVIHAAADIESGQDNGGAMPGVTRPERYILYVGSNKPHKNLVRLVAAWMRVVTAGADAGCRLVIAGPLDKRYARPNAQTIGADSGAAVTYLGRVREAHLAALYRHATLFVFPSLSEGFGLPALEAMSLGTPVVCSNIPALREVTDGAAAMFDPLDVDDIARTIGRLLNAPDERARLAATGRARSSAFSWDRAASETLRVIESAGAG